MRTTAPFLLGAIAAVFSLAACGKKYDPEPIGPYSFCVTLSDCDAGSVCLQNLCVDPTTALTETCLITGASCPDLPGPTIDLASGVDLQEGDAALQGNHLLVVRAILGVDLYAHLFDVSAPIAPTDTLGGVSIVGVRAEPDRPRVSCTGFGFGMVWTDSILGDRSVWFGRLTSEGVPVTSDVLVARHGQEADVVWAGGDFGVAYTNPPGSVDPGIWFTRVDGVGFLLLDEPILVADRINGGAAYPAIAHDGQDTYAIAWNEGPSVRFALVNVDGTVMFDDEVGNGATGVRAVQVVYNGDGWGVMWRSTSGPTMRTLMPSGIPAFAESSIGTFVGEVEEHRLAWMGDRYWAAWADPTLAPGAITLTSVGLDGQVIDSTSVNGGGVSASPPHFFGADELAGVVFSVTTRPGETDPDDLVYATATCN